MESQSLQVFLRVLYTVNSNPQYILAKSSSKVSAVPCSVGIAHSNGSEPTYAQAPLKVCLGAVLDSSPELLQDPTRDFSLYVLDPLEAQPQPMQLAQATHSSNSPRGVAVALGLMSWTLESNGSENVFVTGTVIPGTTSALEVVFALRETRRMPKTIMHMYPSWGPMASSDTSQPLLQAAGTGWSYAPHSQQPEQETLTRSADFPELYIGPPRRSRGRPEGSTSSKLKTSTQGADSCLFGASSSKAAQNQSTSKSEVGKRSKTKTKSRPPQAPPTQPPFVCAPLARTAATGRPISNERAISSARQQFQFSQDQTHPHSSSHPINHPLLGLLSAIPSISPGNNPMITTPHQQAAFLSALQRLLVGNSQLLELGATSVEYSPTEATEKKPKIEEREVDDESGDADSDIVILDSSSVDTAAFRKPSNMTSSTSHQDSSLRAINQDSPTPSSQGTNFTLFPASTPPSIHMNAPASSETLISTSRVGTPIPKDISPRQEEKASTFSSHTLAIPATPTPSRSRKRKLGECTHDQVHLSTTSPPSPSPCTSSLESILTARGLVQSSPTGGIKSTSLLSARLPSMLGSMRAAAASSSRLQNGNQSTTLVSAPLKLKEGHPKIAGQFVNGTLSDPASLKRRRTLSEFMAEQEARQRTKVRKRSPSGRKLEEASRNGSEMVLSTQTNVTSTSKHTQSSPPRPLFRSDSATSSRLISTFRPTITPSVAVSNFPSPTFPTVPPALSPKTMATDNPFKNFVTPAWARTSTAMLPRLSEEALARQRAEREAKKAQTALRRREAARTKRRQLRGAARPSKESSEDEPVASGGQSRMVYPSSSVARPGPIRPPPLTALPIFASDAVEPIPPSSPAPSNRSLALPVVPSTPPRKPATPGSAPYRTPNKSNSCSLFTPSGEDLRSLFTPSTPSVTRPAFMPRSPTALLRSGSKRSPRKSASQAPWTPKRSTGHHQTPRSLHARRNGQFVSPTSVMHASQAQTGMGARAFLLPPPSPCAARSPYSSKRANSAKAPGSFTPVASEEPQVTKPQSPSKEQSIKNIKGGGRKESNMSSCKPDHTLLGEDESMPGAQCSSTPPAVDESEEASELHLNADAFQAEKDDEYASSPLPPSSPLPGTPFSSPAKAQHYGNDFDTLTDDFLAPDSDILFPTTNDSDGAPDTTILPLLSDGGSATWFTDSEASAWLTETEAWLTDRECGPLPTDSDRAWLSDSDAVLGDMSSLPPSAASNWLSDTDVDTDGEVGMTAEGRALDAAAWEVLAALVESATHPHGADVLKAEGTNDVGVTQVDGTRGNDAEFWESVRSCLELSGNAGTATVDVGSERVNDTTAQDQEETTQPMLELRDHDGEQQ